MPRKAINQHMHSLSTIFIDRFLRKYEWLISLAQKHSVNPILLQDIMDSLHKIVSLRKEGEQLYIGLVLSKKQLKINQPLLKQKSFHISKAKKFMDLKNVVNGHTFCYVIDEKGMASIGQVPSNLSKNTSRLTLKEISQTFQTITFYLGGSTTEIYDSGKLFRIYRHGVWMKPCVVPLTKLDAKGFPLDLLELVLRLCIKLSEKDKGSTFAIIRDDFPQHCSPLIRSIRFKKCMVKTMPERQILSFADLDGAIILNTKYEIINIGQKLEPPPPLKNYNREAGRGTRHNCAAMYSSVVDSVVFVVSRDGPISIYFNGDLFSRCFKELFGID